MKLYNKSPSQLQYSLNRIVEWSEKWPLQLAPDKCQILSLIGCRRSFNPCEYSINSHKLTRADIVRDLEVLIDFSLHFDKHIDNIIIKASNVSKLILLSFSTRDQNILMKALCTYVRPILEYNSPVWSPHRKSLIDRIEKIQKRFTKAIPTLSPHPYIQRLKLLKLPSLEKRRLLADLSLCFKIKKSPYSPHNSSHQLKLLQNPRPQSQINNRQIPLRDLKTLLLQPHRKTTELFTG